MNNMQHGNAPPHYPFFKITKHLHMTFSNFQYAVRAAVISAKKHKRQRRKRQSINTKREKSQTPKVLTAILTLPNLT